jgi:hypothetical protein
MYQGGLPASFRIVSSQQEHVISKVLHCILDLKESPLEAPAFPELGYRYGSYAVETDRGSAVLDCRPAIVEAGQKEFDQPEWYVRDIRLREGPGGLPTPRVPRGESGMGYNLRGFFLLYELEGRLRWFVYAVMRAKYGGRWWEDEHFWGMTNELKGTRDVKCAFEEAQRRQHKEGKLLCITLRQADLWAYLDFPDLCEIMKTFSGDFSSLLGEEQGSLFGTLEMLEPIRNALAHNRPLSQEAFQKLREARGIVRRLVLKAETDLKPRKETNA